MDLKKCLLLMVLMPMISVLLLGVFLGFTGITIPLWGNIVYGGIIGSIIVYIWNSKK